MSDSSSITLGSLTTAWHYKVWTITRYCKRDSEDYVIQCYVRQTNFAASSAS